MTTSLRLCTKHSGLYSQFWKRNCQWQQGYKNIDQKLDNVYDWVHTSGSPAAAWQRSGLQGCVWRGSASPERCIPPSPSHGCGLAGRGASSPHGATDWLLARTENVWKWTFQRLQSVHSWRLTFVFSLLGAIVAKESLQHGFLWSSGLNSLFLHQPQEAASLISPGQSPHLMGSTNPTSPTLSSIQWPKDSRQRVLISHIWLQLWATT